jgi:hypothetical protein
VRGLGKLGVTILRRHLPSRLTNLLPVVEIFRPVGPFWVNALHYWANIREFLIVYRSSEH